MERATILLRLMRIEEAADCFGRLRNAQPDQPLGWVRQADTLVRLGRFSKADALIEDGLERFPANAELLVQAAQCATRAGDFLAARKRWAQVRLVAPDDFRLRNALGGVETTNTAPPGEHTPAAWPAAGRTPCPGQSPLPKPPGRPTHAAKLSLSLLMKATCIRS